MVKQISLIFLEKTREDFIRPGTESINKFVACLEKSRCENSGEFGSYVKNFVPLINFIEGNI